MSSGGGGGQQSSTTTQVNYSPEEAAARARVAGRAETLYNTSLPIVGRNPDGTPIFGQTTNVPNPGPAPVPFSPDTIAAQNMTRYLATTQVPQTLGAMNQGVQYGLNDIIHGNDPTLGRAIDASVRPITEAYTDPGGLFSQQRTEMMNNGMLGSSRDVMMSSILGGRYADAVGDTAAKLAAASRSDTLKTFSNTMAFAPQAMQTNLLPAQMLSAVGSQNESLAQAQADKAAQDRLWTLNYPWMSLGNYANIVYGGSNPSTTSTSEGTAPRQNPFSTAAGAISTGVALYSLFALMSDRRLKSNVVRLATHPRGFGIYSYDIFGQRAVGVMADEVQKVLPEAVGIDPVTGYMFVNYAIL